MSWINHIAKLEAGESVSFRPHGQSMSGKIESGQLVTIDPATEAEVGDVVLAKVHGRCYLHLVKAVRGKQYQIANNHGHVNGWTTRIYGKVVRVAP